MKQCGRCKTEKPVEKFSKDKSNKDGLCKMCKQCTKEYKKEYYVKNRQKVLDKNKKYKDNNKEEILEWLKEYRLENRGVMKNYNNIYYLNNSDKIKVNTRKYAQTEKGRVMMKRIHQSRRAIKIGVYSESFNSSEVFERDSYICQMCGIETLPELEDYNDAEYPNLDHIIPLSRGGNHTKENTQCLCHRCNMIKGASYIDFDLIKEKDNKNVKCSV